MFKSDRKDKVHALGLDTGTLDPDSGRYRICENASE